MGWMPGIPHDQGVLHGGFTPQAIVLHRTYGAWGGDYSVGKQGIFQFLIGKDEGNWVQFAPSDDLQWHCNGANRKATGIEIEGTNEDELTAWQSARLGDVLRWLSAEHGIPLTYLDPNSVPPASVWVNGGGFVGVISHLSVRTDDGTTQHTDQIPVPWFDHAVGGVPVPTPTPPKKDDDPMLYVFNPAAPTEIWCLSGNTRRHVTPDEWKFVSFVGGKAIKVSQAWFDSFPMTVS